MASFQIKGDGGPDIICHDIHLVSSRGFWKQSNPLDYAIPLLLLQLSLISMSCRLIDLCLHPLQQSSIVSQILGGIVFGPSLLGQESTIASNLFPRRSTMVLETFASFGLMFFFFIMGVKADASMMFRPGKMAMAIGAPVMISTAVLTTALSFLLKKYVSMDDSLAKSLPLLAASQTLTAFPNIACILTELKIFNTDLGRLAMASSMFCDILGFSLVAVGFTVLANTHLIRGVMALVSALSFVAFVVCVFRPVVLWIRRNTPEEKAIGGTCIRSILAAVLLAGLVGELIGQHFIFGPMVLGLAVPEGPPLGAAIVAKLDSLISSLLYPTFLTVSGLQTNIFKIDLQAAYIVFTIVLFASLVKITTVLIAAYYIGIPLREALALGLLLNAKGICELVVYNLCRDGEILSDQEFALAVISVVAVTAIIVPLIKILYDPTRHKLPIKRRTIHQSKRSGELRILVCIHKQENIPTVVNLLEASCATEDSPIEVTALLLVELVGRTTPMLIAHQPHQSSKGHASGNRSGHIVNALHQYQDRREGCVTVQTYSAISQMEIMHEDICRMSIDSGATIVIVPFHKQWAIDGNIERVNRTIQQMNIKVLEKAPCSVGILIDRGILNGSLSIVNSQSTYNVAVVYIGGPDDVESLAYGARMANHENVTLTVIRFLLFGGDNARERKLDNDLIDEVREANMRNEAFSYQEAVVRDGVELTECIRRLEEGFDLIIAGRQHQDSSILQGLGEWSECPELGVIGDMLASPDFGSAASVLVVQQQRVVGGTLVNRATKGGGGGGGGAADHRDMALHLHHGVAAAATSSTFGVENGPAAWHISME
ncbi:cation/H(+) antiporter 15-like [Diospyros lotus]|uniref:cation/H(+) antiporter 15-like n=1 Tax=Diospyros lotus TaxID=55363 RepID=UPI00224D8DD1|nr:cation/H(+) antiporter 15-like [Diospyros lotus]